MPTPRGRERDSEEPEGEESRDLVVVVIEADGESSANSVTGGGREHLQTLGKDGRRTSLSIAFRGTDFLSIPESTTAIERSPQWRSSAWRESSFRPSRSALAANR